MALHAAALDAELWDAARRGFTQANTRRLAVRAVALTLDRLEIRESQLGLWDVFHQDECSEESGTERGDGRERRLQHAMDRINTRYGARTLSHGSTRVLTR